MSQWKPGLTFRNTPLIVRAIEPTAEVCGQIIIVGGYRFESLRSLVFDSTKIADSLKKKITFVENKEFTAGMFSSVQAGVRCIEPSIDAAYIVPGDMPMILAGTYAALARSSQTAPEISVFIPAIVIDKKDEPGQRRQKKGHPILVRRNVFQPLLSEDKGSTLRNLLSGFPAKVCVVQDEGIGIDIDEEADLANLESTLQVKDTERSTLS